MPTDATSVLSRRAKPLSPIIETCDTHPATASLSWSHHWPALIGVFVLALTLRGLFLILMYAARSDSTILYLVPDSGRYVQIGTYLAGLPYAGPALDWHSGPIYATPEGSMFWSGPGYGAMLAPLFAMFGVKAWPILICQVLMGSVSCVLISILAWQLQLSWRTSVLAGCVGALSLTSISLTCAVLTEALFFMLHLAGMLCLVVGARRNKWLWFLLSAVLFGSGTFVRGVTLFWPAMLIPLALFIPRDKSLGSSKQILCKSLVCLMLMSSMIAAWSARNYVRHGVLSFSEGGVLAARYFWTARALAGLDPNLNTRAMQKKMEAENSLKYGPQGATFADHHRDDTAVFFGALKDHPGPMAKRFVKSALANATRGSELHAEQLPQFSGLWAAIEPLIHKNAGRAILVLIIVGGIWLLYDPRSRGAGVVLILTYLYFTAISGFEFWQGSRICYPAQMSWAVLLAVAADRTLHLIARRRWSRV